MGDEGPSGEVHPVPSRTEPPHPRLEGPLLARLAWGESKKERLGARGANWWSHVGDTERRAVDGTSIGALIISTVGATISSRSGSDSSLVLRDRYHDRNEVHTAMRELIKTMDKLLTAVRDQEAHAVRGHGRGRSLKRARCSNRASGSY